MPFDDFLSKVRSFDNQASRWMMRHFYFIFFEFVLVIIFFIFLYNTFRMIDLGSIINHGNALENLLYQQIGNTLLIIILLLLNSFWMLYMFNGINRIRVLLRDINFNLLRQRKKD